MNQEKETPDTSAPARQEVAMHKFTHIESFKSVAHIVRARAAYLGEGEPFNPCVTFHGSPKLHGTNASVVIHPDHIQAQSRRRHIDVGDDNYGFAAFVAEPENVKTLRYLEGVLRSQNSLDADVPVAIYGEWIGPGIQQSVAVCGLPERQWVVFAAAVIKGDDKRYIDARRLSEHGRIYNIDRVPSYEVTIDLTDPVSVENALRQVDKLIEDIEAQCPWGARFDIDGVGEGLVWTPQGKNFGDSDLFWKSKGEKHKGKDAKDKKPRVSVNPETLSGEGAFVEFAVTETRLKQGLDFMHEMGHTIDMKNVRHFLAWVGGDVKRECAAEIEANGFDWKRMSKRVTQKAVAFFRAEADRA